jgi:hypothetical protein
MRTIQLQSRVGADGMLRLQVPVGVTNTDLEVIVIVQPRSPEATPSTPTERGWPPGFFKQTAGSIQDEMFKRHPQGGYGKRLELE